MCNIVFNVIIIGSMLTTAFYHHTKYDMPLSVKGWAALLMCTVLPVKLFGANTMLIWCLLVFSSYTDILDRTVFYRISYGCIVVEIILSICRACYGLGTMQAVIIPIIIVLFITKIHAVAYGDRDIFLATVFYAQSEGMRVFEYIIVYIFISCVIFLVYMSIINIINIINKRDKKGISNKGAFVPAMAAAFMVIEFLR